MIDKIRALPPERIAEAEDFVEFLTTKDRQRAAMDRFLAVAPALEQAGAPAIERAVSPPRPAGSEPPGAAAGKEYPSRRQAKRVLDGSEHGGGMNKAGGSWCVTKMMVATVF